jgi:hypothetical protein
MGATKVVAFGKKKIRQERKVYARVFAKTEGGGS